MRLNSIYQWLWADDWQQCKCLHINKPVLGGLFTVNWLMCTTKLARSLSWFVINFALLGESRRVWHWRLQHHQSHPHCKKEVRSLCEVVGRGGERRRRREGKGGRGRMINFQVGDYQLYDVTQERTSDTWTDSTIRGLCFCQEIQVVFSVDHELLITSNLRVLLTFVRVPNAGLWCSDLWLFFSQELARRVERGEINEDDLCLEEVCTPVWPWAT